MTLTVGPNWIYYACHMVLPSSLRIMLANARSIIKPSSSRILSWMGHLTWHVSVTGLDDRGDVNLAQLCPPGFAVWHLPWAEGRGGGVAVVYHNNSLLTGKPVQQQLGLECWFVCLFY